MAVETPFSRNDQLVKVDRDMWNQGNGLFEVPFQPAIILYPDSLINLIWQKQVLFCIAP
jgi:hypothetical protein